MQLFIHSAESLARLFHCLLVVEFLRMDIAIKPDSAAELNDLAVRLQSQGRYLEADELYKRSLAIWEAALGLEDPLIAQSLSNRAALYRQMGEHHEAERLFQIALRIWSKRGFPEHYDTPLWADRLENDLTLRHFGARVRSMRDRLINGDADARSEVAETIHRLGTWYHNVVF